MTDRPLLVSESGWIRQLGEVETRVRVELGVAPVRLHTPPEWNNGPHRIQEHLIYFFAQEGAQAEVAGESFFCGRNSCCWLTPGTVFRFFSDQSPVIWRFRFSLLTRRGGRPIAPRQRYYFLPNTPIMAETINALLAELGQQDGWQPAALRSRLLQLSILFFRRPGAGGKPRLLTSPQQNALTALLENTPPDRWLKPHDLAEAAGLSADYFSRVFHRTHGLAPREWLVRQRLSYAVVLLQETPLRVGEIAQRLGYANLHLFSRQFAARFGRSPRFFRQ